MARKVSARSYLNHRKVAGTLIGGLHSEGGMSMPLDLSLSLHSRAGPPSKLITCPRPVKAPCIKYRSACAISAAAA